MLADQPLMYYATAEADRIISELESSINGLSEEEAKTRQNKYGKNVFAHKKKFSVVSQFLSNFKNPLIVLLLAAAILSFFFGEDADALIIMGLALMSVVLDFWLEYSAEKAAESLKESVKTTVMVIRSGVKKEIKIEGLCIGDIIVLSAGCMVPADSRIINSKDFFINQSSLTGESFPVEKKASKIISKKVSLTDMDNIAFMGTNAISGSATAVVIKTGKETEFGKIAEKLTQQQPETEFERGIKNFGYLIMKATAFIVIFIFLFNSIVKHLLFESFIFAVAVAVGLVPELLPMIMSVTMAQGSLKMSNKGVIIKKLSSIPDFGSMDVLCTDKTGTLTEDKIELVKYTDVLGKDSEDVLEYAYLNSYYQTGINNLLDRAVLTFRKISVSGFKKVEEIPFDFIRKKMSVVVEKNKKRYMITKGAPEEIFESASYYISQCKRKPIQKNSIEKIKEKYYEFSREGYKVLAVAVKEIKNKREYTKNDERNLTLFGFISFLDPAKKDAKEVLQELKKAGIEVKVITGDNELVTKKICKDIGLSVKGVLLGKEISNMPDDTLKIKAEETTIFARFSPDNKNRVINILRSNGHVVGYMGDGINDAPSLKSADVGISVNSAVDVAKESATVVLTKKSFAELKHGVFEGRKTFANSLKYIMMGLSSNFGNMFSMTIGILFLPFLPMAPIQILLNNFIYDFSQITIPSDNVDEDLIQKPKRWDIGFIKKFMLALGPISSIFDVLTFLILFFVFKLPAAAFQTGWFLESLATQTLVIHIIRTKKIPFFQSTASFKLLFSSIACVVIGWILPYTYIGKLFGLVQLPYYILLCITGIIIIYLFVMQIAKTIFYKIVDF